MNEERADFLRITKLDAATRQLRTAIRLFFEEADVVSIHTLAAASHEMVRSLVKFKGGASLIKDNDFIRPERKKDYEDLINRPRNFFKHAGRDPYQELEFHHEENRFWIIDTIMMHRDLSAGQLQLTEFVLFLTWFTIDTLIGLPLRLNVY
jgi:hypothetical protein